MATPAPRKEFKKPANIGKINIKVDTPVTPESVTSQIKKPIAPVATKPATFKAPPTIGKLTPFNASVPKKDGVREAIRKNTNIGSEVDKLMRNQPIVLPNYTTRSAGVSSPVAKTAAVKDGEFKKFVRDIKGGAQALVSSDMSVLDKAKAVGKAPVDLMVGGGNALRDFARITIPKAFVTVGKAIADNIDKNGELGRRDQDTLNMLKNKGRDTTELEASLRETQGKRDAIAKKVSSWADTVITGYNEMQRESMARQGITEDTSIADPTKLGYGIGSGLGSIAAYLGVTFLSKNPVAGASLLGIVEGSDTYNKALADFTAEGMNKNEAEKKAGALAMVESAGIMVLEKIGMDALFRSYAGGKLRNAAIGSITETLQESTQTVWSNMVEKYGYDETKSLYDGLFETIITTLPIGALAGGFSGSTDPVINIDAEDTSSIPPEERQAAADELLKATQDEVSKFSRDIEAPEALDDATIALYEDIAAELELSTEDEVIDRLVASDDLPATMDRTEVAELVEEAKSFTNNVEVPPDISSEIDDVFAAVTNKAPVKTPAETKKAEEPANTTEDIFEDIPEQLRQAAEEVWDKKYAEQYTELNKRYQELQKQAKSAQGAELATIKSKIEEIGREMGTIEDTFIEEQRQEIAIVQKQNVERAVEEVLSVEPQAPKVIDRATLPASLQRDLSLYETINYSDPQANVNTDDLQKRISDALVKQNLKMKWEGPVGKEKITVYSVDKEAESGTVDSNGKTDSDTRGDVRDSGDTSRGSVRDEGQGVRGSADTVDSDTVARGERDRSGASAGDGSSETVKRVDENGLWLDKKGRQIGSLSFEEYLTDNLEGVGRQRTLNKSLMKTIYDREVRKFNEMQVDIGTEEVVYTEAGVVSITNTTPIAEKQKTRLAQVIVDVVKEKGLSLADESLFLVVQNKGYMPLNIERLVTNELAVSHTYIQNGDVMRDPEIVFNIDKDGQLIAKTIENTGLGSVPKPISNTDEFLDVWARNIRNQGYTRKRVADEDKEKAFDYGKINRAKITALEADMRAIYLNAGEKDEDGYAKADEVFSNIMTELDLAEAGYKVFTDEEVYGVSSTFPDWIPDASRNREDLDYLIETFKDVRGLSYPRKRNETKRREFADALFTQLDLALDVNTRVIRDKILNLYEEIDTRSTEGDTAEGQDGTTRSEEEAIERAEGVGLSVAEVEGAIKDRAYIDVGNIVHITNGKPPTKDELRIFNAWQPAGGRESEGAEGRGLLDEYYTPEEVVTMVQSMLDKAGAFAKDGIRVLEPSIGTGNFLSVLPKTAKVDGFEINEISARVAKLKHPNATIFNRPLEDVFMDNRGNKKQWGAIYDLVLGNPPYGTHRGTYKGLGEEPKITRYENYFIKRGLDLTVTDGHVAMVIPSGFLRGGKGDGKEDIARMGELVAAVRLPNGTFSTTGIGTDIVLIKKAPVTDQNVIDSRISLMSGDNYFSSNPQYILGEKAERRTKFGMEEAIAGSLDSAIERFKETDQFVATDEMVVENTVTEPAVTMATVEEQSNQELVDSLATGSKAEVAMAEEELKNRMFDRIRTETEAKAEPEVKEVPKRTPGVLDLAQYGADLLEAGQWRFVSATGELQGDFDADKAFYMAGKYYNEFNYAQGDVYAKLEQLERDKDIIGPEKYATQKAMLEAIKPAPMTVERMRLAPYVRFAEEVMLSGVSLQTRFLSWIRDLPMNAFGQSSYRDVANYTNGVAVRGGDKLQNEQDRRTRRTEGDRLFKLFLTEELTPKEKQTVENEFNRRYNAYAKPDYTKVPLVSKITDTYGGKPLEIRAVQRQGIGFLLNKGTGLLAHDVGLGKTMQGIIANFELIERGWAKRPLIVVPSVSVYRQWIKDIKALKPDVKVNELANLGGDFKGDLATLAIEPGTLSIITEEGFKRLGFSDATYRELTKDLNDVIENPNEKKTKRQAELEKSKTEETVGKGMKGARTERTFEELGFDAITVDEIHNYNHIIASAKADDKKATEFRGFSQMPSISGIKLWLAAQFVMKNNNGRNVFGLSATPFTNHPLEYYSILSLFARERMTEMGIRNVNDFMSLYMDIVAKDEVRADGTIASRLDVRGFNNAQQFQALLREFIDFRDGEEAGIIRPERQSREFIVGENEMSYDYKMRAQELFEEKEAGTLRAMTELQQIAFSPYASQYHTGPVPTAKQFVENSPKIKLATEMIAKTYGQVKESNHLIYSKSGKEFFPLIKQYLVEEKGIPANEIEIITGSTAKPQRTVIQDNFNAGKVRVVIGNEAIEEGINLQKKTTDLYLLSQPWNFTQVRQVIGRAWRQGNQWRNVRVNQFFTENTFDMFLSQAIEKKRVRYQQSLQTGSDYIDAGDVDYEALMFDLMTDPVMRTRAEFNEKRKRLEQEIQREKADFAQANRRNKAYVEAVGKLNNARDFKRKNGSANQMTQNWINQSVTKAEENLQNLRKDLRDRGVDVSTIDQALAASEAKINAMTAELDTLREAEEKAIEVAKEQAKVMVSSARATDYKKFIVDLDKDNSDLFLSEKPMFRRVGSDFVTLATLDAIQNEVKQETITRETLSNFLRRDGIKAIERETIEFGANLVEQDGVINVAALVAAVEKDLITLTTAPLMEEDIKYQRISLQGNKRGAVADYTEHLYQSPFANNAGGIHFDKNIVPNYFAHARVEDMADGVTRRVIELQSDLFQKDRINNDAFSADPDYAEENEAIEMFVEYVAKEKGISIADADEMVMDGDIEMVPEEPLFQAFLDKMNEEAVENRKALLPYRNTWYQRVIREELKRAAIEGKAYVQFPTGETAMEIEGLSGRGANRFRIVPPDGRNLADNNVTPDTLKVGQVLYDLQSPMGVRFGDITGEWVVTSILQDGLFKAVPRRYVLEAEQIDLPLRKAENRNDFTIDKIEKLEFNYGETFDIRGGIDTNNPIFKFYESEMKKYLTNNFGGKVITDDAGVSWVAVGVNSDLANRPVYAFQTVPTRDMSGRFTGSMSKADREALARSLGYVAETNLNKVKTDREYKVKMTATTFEQARAQLARYKKQFNLQFDVELADRIFFEGSKIRNKILAETQAYAVFFNQSVILTPTMPMLTAHHEFVHLVMKNLKRIPAFSGFTKEALYLDALSHATQADLDLIGRTLDMSVTKAELYQKTKGWSSLDGLPDNYAALAEELIAYGFEDHLANRAVQMTDLQRRWGKTLARFIMAFKDAVVRLKDFILSNDAQTVMKLYDAIRTGRGSEQTVVLTKRPEYSARVKFETSEGLKYVDFDEAAQGLREERNEQRSAFFRAVEPKDELMTNKVFMNKEKLNFIMKDINTLEDITAQARDIYLKDPEQFEVANELEQIGEAHDADKEILDNKIATLIEPYMKLKAEDRKKVNEALWSGDDVGKEFTDIDLIYMGFSDEQTKAYRAVRTALDVAHEMLLQEMMRKGIDPEEVDAFRQERTGYMPHKWIPKLNTAQKLKSFVTGKEVVVVKHQRMIDGDSKYTTWHMDAFATEKEALEVQRKLMAENDRSDVRYVVDKLSSLEVDFFSSQELSQEKMVAVIENMREQGYVKDQVVDILKNNLMDMFKEKGFGRHYLKRTGVRGYDTENTEMILAEYFAGFSGYLTKMRWSSNYFLSLSKIDARRQQRFFAWSRDLIAYKLNNKPEWRLARTISFAWYLANDLSYLLTNALQNVILGTGEISKYVDGADKAWKPEAYLIKAMKDWGAKTVSPEELKAIESLLEKGQLGAEMTSELMGFKNNPLYREISSTFSKALYASTGIVERNVNRIPAFLAMRRIFKEQGYSDEAANTKALEVSNDIHFRYGRHHRPRFLRGRLNVVFVFQHYIRTLLYQLYRDLSRREYLAFARKMMYTSVIGGYTALPFAKLILGLFAGIGDEEDDEELKKEMTLWQIILEKGVPAGLINVDMSSRIGIELLTVNKISENPSDIRTYMGTIGDLFFKKPFEVVDLAGQERTLDALAKALPDMFANPLRAYIGYNYGVRSFAGVPLLDDNGDTYRYTGWEAAIKAIGFTPTQEALYWEAKGEEFKREAKQREEVTQLGRTIRGMVQRGEFEEARRLQDQAIADGTIAETTDYIRKYAKDDWFKEAVNEWNSGDQSRRSLKAIEEELIEKVYGGVATDRQMNNVRKELAVYRQFGMDNEDVRDIMKAQTNKEKVKMLLEMKDNMGEEAFDDFVKKGRSGIYTEAGSRVPILISDDLLEMLKEAEKNNDNQN